MNGKSSSNPHHQYRSPCVPFIYVLKSETQTPIIYVFKSDSWVPSSMSSGASRETYCLVVHRLNQEGRGRQHHPKVILPSETYRETRVPEVPPRLSVWAHPLSVLNKKEKACNACKLAVLETWMGTIAGMMFFTLDGLWTAFLCIYWLRIKA